MAAHFIRFNLAKAQWEAPPINIMEAMSEFLPKQEDLPENLREAVEDAVLARRSDSTDRLLEVAEEWPEVAS